MELKLQRKILLTLFLITVIQTSMYACRCGQNDPVFCKNVNEEHHIIRAIVTDTSFDEMMEVELIENIHQEIGEDRILIYGNDGNNCGENLDKFAVNDTLILALTEQNIKGVHYWYLHACGLHFLKYEDGMVKGQITNLYTELLLQDFKDKLFYCFGMEVVLGEVEPLCNQITIFPNPVLDDFYVGISQNWINGYEIYNSVGQLMAFEKFNQFVDEIEFKPNNLSSGVYFIRISNSKGSVTKKFLKV